MKTQHGRDLTGTEMAEMLAEWTNGAYETDIKAFVVQMTQATHRTLQQSTMRLVGKLIWTWAHETRFDARNEATIALAKKLTEKIQDEYDFALPHI